MKLWQVGGGSEWGGEEDTRDILTYVHRALAAGLVCVAEHTFAQPTSVKIPQSNGIVSGGGSQDGIAVRHGEVGDLKARNTFRVWLGE